MPDKIGGGSKSIIDINNATANFQFFMVALLHNLGQIGNAIFVIASAWFLMDSKRVKSSKIMGMVEDCFIISVLFLIAAVVVGYDLPVKYIIKKLMPITFSSNWFVTCYLLLYLIHPFLNIIIHNVDKRKLLQMNIIFGVLYFGIGFFLNNSVFYFSRLIGFVGIYFIVAYVKLHLKNVVSNMKIQGISLGIGIIGWITLMLVTNVMRLKIGIFSDWLMRWNTFMNPFFILISFSLFNIFRAFNFKSRWINYISGLSLLIYVIHCNRVIRDYVRFDIFEYIYVNYSYDNILFWIFLYAFVSFAAALVLAILYKETIGKAVREIVNRVYGFGRGYIIKLLSLIEKVT